MKIQLNKQLKTALNVILKLNTRDLPIYVSDGFLSAQTNNGKVQVPFCESGLIPENFESGFDNVILKYITSFDVGKTVEIIPDGNTMKIKCGKCCTQFSTPKNESVSFIEISNEKKITVDCASFCESLMSVSSICDTSNKSSNNLAQIVYIKVDEDKMLIEGTDGHKMFCNTLKCNATSEGVIMFPAASAKYLCAIFKNSSESIHLYPDSRYITITNDCGYRCDFVQMNASYPHDLLSRAVSPEDSACKATINVDELISSVTRSISLTREHIGRDFSLTLSKSAVLVECLGTSVQYADEIYAKVSGELSEDIKIYCSDENLLTLIKAFDGDIDAYFGSYSRGVIFRNKNASGCIMPMLKKK